MTDNVISLVNAREPEGYSVDDALGMAAARGFTAVLVIGEDAEGNLSFFNSRGITVERAVLMAELAKMEFIDYLRE